MGDEPGARIGGSDVERRSSEQRSASGDVNVPERPDAGVTAGNDPTDGGPWIRRRIAVEGRSAVRSLDEAADTLLQLPGVLGRRRPTTGS